MQPAPPSRQQIEQAIQQALQIHSAGNLARAEEIYRQVLTVVEHPAALHYLGVIAHQIGRNEQALPLILRSLELAPHESGYFCNLGEVYRQMLRLDEAEAALLRSIALDPVSENALNNLGLVYLAQRRFADAKSALSKAVAAHPRNIKALSNLGVALQSLGQLEQAAEMLQKTIAQDPSFEIGYTNLSSVLSHMGRTDEAMALLDRSPARDTAAWHMMRTHVLLLAGRFREGWVEYEWRLRGKPEVARNLPYPIWNGEPLAGKRILLFGEQGFGDTIQFARYVPLIAQQGATVILECQPALTTLLKTIQGASMVLSTGDPLPPVDFCCSLLGLPLRLGTDMDSIPSHVPYLSADDERVSAWRQRVEEESPGQRRIGIAWSGNPLHEKDAARSSRLLDWAALGQLKHVTFYSLQKGAGSEQAGQPPGGMRLIDASNDLPDFAASAALVTALDAVISIDSAVAHLAGALARPVWTLLPAMAEWRWMRERTDSPWYPTMKLLRQRQLYDWPELMERLAQELRDWIAQREMTTHAS